VERKTGLAVKHQILKRIYFFLSSLLRLTLEASILFPSILHNSSCILKEIFCELIYSGVQGMYLKKGIKKEKRDLIKIYPTPQ
jgi:hypothetical protein